MFTKFSQKDKIIFCLPFTVQYFDKTFFNFSSIFSTVSTKSKSKSVENLSNLYKK